MQCLISGRWSQGKTCVSASALRFKPKYHMLSTEVELKLIQKSNVFSDSHPASHICKEVLM